MLSRLLAGASLLLVGAAGRADPCITIPRAGLRVQGDVRVCPGVYRVPDPTEQGVLVVAASATRIDLTGVTIESGDSIPSRYVGVGVLSHGFDGVVVTGGRIRGYRYGVFLDGGRGHQVTGMDVSGSRAQPLQSTPIQYAESDWLDIFDPDTFETYGGGVYLRHTDGASVTGVTAHGAQNGIGLFEATGTYVADNDVSGNSGWGIHLWRSSHNVIVRNVASRNVRCESAAYSRGCDSAALLLRNACDSNLVADNDLTESGDGFFLSGQPPAMDPSDGNVVVRNDASRSPHNAFESTFSDGNVFLDDRADSSDYGYWLGYSSHTLVRGSTIVGSRSAGIAIEHGRDNELRHNLVLGGNVGIRLFAPGGGVPSRTTVVTDNTIGRAGRGVVLEATSGATLRGNVFDAVGTALVADSAAWNATVVGNVFLGARDAWIVAPDLAAGGNYWAAPDVAATLARIKGRVSVLPWLPASAAGY
ncbi:MAG TPA: NosD domain-containing protein [Gemmatimonadales bacterium]|nr:NosD domain-containing protein [Gemmatimonadales bacterium]